MKVLLDLLKSLKLNSVKQEHNLVQDGLGFVFTRWKTRCLQELKSRQSINASVVEELNLRNGCLGTCLLFALQNRRPDYIEAFFNTINWTEVSRRFASEIIQINKTNGWEKV
jgi:hypothetical protein